MKTRNKCVPAVYCILEKEGKILIARRCNTGYEDGNYQVPAGHVEEGELPTDALIREAKEEIGIDITPADFQLSHVSYRPKHDETGDRIDFFFIVRSWNGDVTNTEPDKCDDLKWISPTELPDNMTLHIKSAIQAIQQGNFFKEITINDLKAVGLYRL